MKSEYLHSLLTHSGSTPLSGSTMAFEIIYPLFSILTNANRISNGNLKKLRRLDLRPPISDEIVNEWLELHSSLYGQGRPHNYQYVIRMTNSGAKHYFEKDVFPLFYNNF